AVGLADVRWRKFGQQLSDVKSRFAVLRAVVDLHLSLVAVGDGLLEAKQLAFLRDVRPLGIRAPGADAIAVGTFREVHRMMAGRADAPVLHFRELHIVLLDLDPAAVRISGIFRSKLRKGRLGWALVSLRR